MKRQHNDKLIWINKITSFWIGRILVFILLTLFIDLILKFIIDIDYYLLLLPSLLISTLLTEYLRYEGNTYTIGLNVNCSSLLQVLFSFILVLTIILIYYFMAYLSEYSVLYYMNENSLKHIYLYVFLISSYAIIEELIFRGLIFQALIARYGIFITIFLSSTLFVFLHFINNGSNIIFLINVLLGNIAFCLMYYKTRSLYLPISYHIFWNLFQVLFIDGRVSGYNYDISIMKIDYKNSSIISFNQQYGIEGGLVATIALLVSCYLVLKFLSVSPYTSAKLFRRIYAESSL